MSSNKNRYLTVQEAADYLNVTAQKLTDWLIRGEIQGCNTPVGWRIRTDVLEEWVIGYNRYNYPKKLSAIIKSLTKDPAIIEALEAAIADNTFTMEQLKGIDFDYVWWSNTKDGRLRCAGRSSKPIANPLITKDDQGLWYRLPLPTVDDSANTESSLPDTEDAAKP